MEHFQNNYSRISDILLSAGLRPTRQRMFLSHFLFFKCCGHVSAECLYKEAKEAKIKMSLATVYNTLHQFTLKGLLREVSIGNGKSFFDTNTSFHHHFLCEETGKLVDIPADSVVLGHVPAPPPGTHIESINVVIRVRPEEGFKKSA
jgi:Fur family iron response transcriptional regulator